MATFRGKYDFSIDSKGRVNIPAKFRKALSPEADDTFIIVRAPGNCLRVYPRDVWEKGREAELAELPETPDNNRLKSVIFSSLIDAQLDSQGRVMLSQTLMDIAGITKDVTMVGVSSYIEMWDTARYEQYTVSAGDFDNLFYAGGLTKS
ncbi:MAG: division/cell wall cluster transcriptional repressor MraZ [Chitinispirillia bacterium]|nr:division/cell wall cluster transcriptional repressor MraZ [Chitinispirillia bacterium]MCL2241613.1 division/cell wall cluster transcriptional repressor MraZ [Chitinispirillia bacterium]